MFLYLELKKNADQIEPLRLPTSQRHLSSYKQKKKSDRNYIGIKGNVTSPHCVECQLKKPWAPQEGTVVELVCPLKTTETGRQAPLCPGTNDQGDVAKRGCPHNRHSCSLEIQPRGNGAPNQSPIALALTIKHDL